MSKTWNPWARPRSSLHGEVNPELRKCVCSAAKAVGAVMGCRDLTVGNPSRRDDLRSRASAPLRPFADNPNHPRHCIDGPLRNPMPRQLAATRFKLSPPQCAAFSGRLKLRPLKNIQCRPVGALLSRSFRRKGGRCPCHRVKQKGPVSRPLSCIPFRTAHLPRAKVTLTTTE